jgi:hypothetical protein
MEMKGYRITGLLGPKHLRGEHHSLKFRPTVFWGAISFAGQMLVSGTPKKAAAILCVKELSG